MDWQARVERIYNLVEMPFIDTGVGRLSYDVAGEGPPIVLCHSWLADRGIWDHQFESLQRQHRVVRIDGPSHGESELLDRRFSLDDCADAVVDVLDAENIDQAMVAGLSWGGMTAMRLALRAPDRVAGLTLIGTTGEAEPPHNFALVNALGQLTKRGQAAPWLERAVLLGILGATTLVSRRTVVRQELERFRRHDHRGIKWTGKAIVTERIPVHEQLGRIRTPTMVVVGAEDRTEPVWRGRRLAKAIPGATFNIISRCGHTASVERPDVVTGYLHEMAKRVYRA